MSLRWGRVSHDGLMSLGDGKLLHGLTLLLAVPHMQISRLEMAAEQLCVVQRRGITFFDQLILQRRQSLGLGRQAIGLRLVLIERMGDELRHFQRGQQASGDTPLENVPHIGEYGQADKEGICSCRVRVVGVAIEEQIREAIARQMILDPRHTGGKNQPLRIDAISLRLITQVALRRFVEFHQPQHTAFDFLQQAHPDGEDLRRNLVVMVERTEDETTFRQTALRTRRRALRHTQLAISRQI
ncbi:hypothetical protein D3C78_765190 [compost metagenome]